MKKALLILGIALGTLVSGDLYSQNVLSAKKVDATRGPARERPTQDIEIPKPNDNTRGVCCLDFDNYTGYFLDVWVDDIYRGRISPWDRDGICVGAGWTTWYVETAGGTYYWDGKFTNCQSSYVLNIRN